MEGLLSPPTETPTACQKECTSQQQTLVACVETIRASRQSVSSASSQTSASSDGDDEPQDSTSGMSNSTPQCLPGAVAAWTRCCEEANVREREREGAAAEG